MWVHTHPHTHESLLTYASTFSKSLILGSELTKSDTRCRLLKRLLGPPTIILNKVHNYVHLFSSNQQLLGSYHWALVSARHQHCWRCLHHAVGRHLQLHHVLHLELLPPVPRQAADWVQGRGHLRARRSGLPGWCLDWTAIQSQFSEWKADYSKEHARNSRVI